MNVTIDQLLPGDVLDTRKITTYTPGMMMNPPAPMDVRIVASVVREGPDIVVTFEDGFVARNIRYPHCFEIQRPGERITSLVLIAARDVLVGDTLFLPHPRFPHKPYDITYLPDIIVTRIETSPEGNLQFHYRDPYRGPDMVWTGTPDDKVQTIRRLLRPAGIHPYVIDLTEVEVDWAERC